MAQENEVPFKDIELGFTRKSDGKFVNVKLHDLFKQFKNIDFINNEVKINGETLIADSYRSPYSEVVLNIQKNGLNNGDGSYKINDQLFTESKSLNVEKNSTLQAQLIPNENSQVKSVTDENNNNIQTVENTVVIPTDADHTVTINFDSKPTVQ